MSEAAPYVERSRRTEPGVLRRADRTEQLQSYRYPSTGKVVDYFPPNITDEQHIEASPNQSTDSNFDLLPTPIKLEQTREGGPRSFFSPPSPSRRKLSPFRTPSTVSSFDESFIRSPDTTPPFIRKPLRLPPLLDISPVTPPPLSPVRRQLFRTPSPVRRQLFRTPSPVRRQPSPVLSPNRVPSPQPDILQNRHPIGPQYSTGSEGLNSSLFDDTNFNLTESLHLSSRSPRSFSPPSPVLPPPIHQSTPVSSPPSHHSTPPQPVFTSTEESSDSDRRPGVLMVDKSLQLEESFVLQNDFCNRNHWKLYAYSVLYGEVLQMLAKYTGRVYQDDKPHLLAEVLWKYIDEINNQNKVLSQRASELSENKAYLELHIQKVYEIFFSSEQVLIYEGKRIEYFQDEKNELKSRLDGALEKIAFLQRSATGALDQPLERADMLEQAAASENMAIGLRAELEEERSRSENVERSLRAAARARLMASEHGASMGPELLQEVLEAVITESFESNLDTRALSREEYAQIFLNMKHHMNEAYRYHETEILKLFADIKKQKNEMKLLVDEKLDLNTKIVELDDQLGQKRNLIMAYAKELEPYEKILKEWEEYIEDMGEQRIERQPWHPHMPDSQNRFSPPRRSSPKPSAARGF